MCSIWSDHIENELYFIDDDWVIQRKKINHKQFIQLNDCDQ